MTLQELEIYKGKKWEILGDNSGSDDLVFDNMTLQELEIYEGKKRRKLKSADSTNANAKSSRKRNHSHIQFEEEEPDLEDPFYFQKPRLPKQPKVENEWAEDCSSLCNLKYLGSVKPEQESTLFSVNQDSSAAAIPRASIKCEHFLYNCGCPCELGNIKTEIVETKSCILQNAAHFTDCSATNCFADMSSCESSMELLERVDVGELESTKSTPFENLKGFLERVDDEELEMEESAFFNNEYLHCSLNEASTQYFEDMEEPTKFIVNLSGESSVGPLDNFDGGELEMRGSTSFTEETLYCSLNEASTEYMEESIYFMEEVCLSGESSDGLRELETKDSSSTNNESLPCLNEASTQRSKPGTSTFLQEIAKNHCSHCPFTSELTAEGVLSRELSAGSSKEICVLNSPGSDIHSDSISSSSQGISCQMHKITVTQVSEVAIDDSPQCMESNDASYGCISGLERDNVGKIPIDSEVPKNVGKDASMDHEDHSTGDTNGPYSSPQDAEHSVIASNGSFDGHSLQDSRHGVFASVDEVAKSSIGTCPSNGAEGVSALESFYNFHGEKLKHPPERLLSTRKVLIQIFDVKLACMAILQE